MFAVLRFYPSSFIISFALCMLLRVLSLLMMWRVFLHEEHGVVILGFFCSFASFYICSNNVVSHGFSFTECNYCFLREYFF